MRALIIAFLILAVLTVVTYRNAERASCDDFGAGMIVWLFAFLAIFDFILILVLLIVGRS